MFLKDYASYIGDDMVKDLTENNRDLMLSIDVIPIPTDEAVKEVEQRLLGVGTNITNWQRKKFWSWYGFSSHVHWCACFVSWCADQCGYIKAGIIPKFSGVGDGISWFKSHNQWQKRGYKPAPGDIIFIDWESDGTCDHVGIVESCDGKTVHTIEGNSGDACKRQSYSVNSSVIVGYGVPKY